MGGFSGPERLTEQWLRELAACGESTQVEFKREWYDLTKKEGKAKFIRGMLAQGNAVTPTEPGLFIVGVDDAKHGGALRGVANSPPVEALMQIVSSFTSPPVRFAVHQISLTGGTAVAFVERESVHRLEASLRPRHPRSLAPDPAVVLER